MRWSLADRKISDSDNTKTIGVFGHVGNRNLGDEAIISVVLQNIKRRYPTAQIRGYTLKPQDTAERHKIDAFPIRRLDEVTSNTVSGAADLNVSQTVAAPSGLYTQAKATLKKFPLLFNSLKRIQTLILVLLSALKEPRFLLQSYRNLKGLDLLIIAGSSQLIDYVAGGPWGHPYTVFKWVVLAKARKSKVAFMSCGMGPVESMLGKFFIRTSLSIADYRSFRDDVSLQCAEQIGVTVPCSICPDLVYGLRIEEKNSIDVTSNSRPIVGINPIPFSDSKAWVGSGAEAYAVYIAMLAEFARWLVQRGYNVMLFPTQLNLDPPVIRDVVDLLKKGSNVDLERNIIDTPVNTFDELMSSMSKAYIIIATRYHGVVFSHLLNKPVIGIAYASKTADLMRMMGQSDYTVDILHMNLQVLQERFIAIESRETAIKEDAPIKISAHRKALDAQYDQVFGL